MILLHVVAIFVGIVLVMSVLVSALETVVLPRHGFTRIARFVFAVADRVLVHRWRNEETARESARPLRPGGPGEPATGVDALGHLRLLLHLLGDQRRHGPTGLRDQRIVTVHPGVRRTRGQCAGSG